VIRIRSGTVEPHTKIGGFGIRASIVNLTGGDDGGGGEGFESRLIRFDNAFRFFCSTSSLKTC
jgi:hypothetical protein